MTQRSTYRVLLGGLIVSMLLSRCQGGRISEQRLQLDLLGLLQQLGVMPDLSLAQDVIVARLVRGSTAEWNRD